MIYRLKLGTPFETEAIVETEGIIESDEMSFIELLGTYGCELRYGRKLLNETGNELEIDYKLNDATVIYGLGEANRGINKRGYIYVSDNTDDPNHTEDKRSLYGSHNFLLIKDTEEDFGLFFDYPGKMTFDLGYANSEMMHISAETDDMYLYLFTGSDLASIVTAFRRCIGQSYVAPDWGFGYQQSRWGYKSSEDIKEVVNRYRDAGIPLDAVYMDIDYMVDFKDFTVNTDSFPHFPDFVKDMEEQGIHLVPIIDAGVKIEKGYDVYEEGRSRGYFCVNEDGTPFEVGVWPGRTHLPDFLRPEVRKWFGEYYHRLAKVGIDGFWNDMNEPAMFYTKQRLEDSLNILRSIKASEAEPSIDDCYSMRASIDEWTSHKSYKEMFHIIGGKRFSHDKVHNLYGYNMTRAAAEGLAEFDPAKRYLLFSRSSYIGMHRYAGIWTGDNSSWWSHLLLNLQMLPNLNMCGFLYTGADIGGFGCNTTEDLMLRWVALGIFTPLFRNHSALGTREQELYRFNRVNTFKEIISLRYRLIPYLYSEYLKSVYEYRMMFRPLSFDFEDDPEALEVDDQLMLGEGLMIAPVYTQNAHGRHVYLPEPMDLIMFNSAFEYTVTEMPAGHHYIRVELNQIPIFLRKGHILPLGNVEVCTMDMRSYHEAGSRGGLERGDFKIIGSDDDHYEMWTDAGITPVPEGCVSTAVPYNVSIL